jgi:ABC-2 type transport system permease protein
MLLIINQNQKFIFMSSNIVAFQTIVNKEVSRFMRIWSQTLLPSAITQSLYFLIFGAFVGSQIPPINGISYMQFIVPGLVMMAVITNAFANVVSSFFGAKFQKNIEEMLVAPVSNWSIIWGFTIGGSLRGMLVGAIVWVVSFFFTQQTITNPLVTITFAALTSIVFSLLGLLNGIFAKKFDDVGIVTTFVLTPLTYLGGVFYSINRLPPFWRAVSSFNPIVYMVDGFRYGFYGKSDFNLYLDFGILILFTVALTGLNYYLLKKGIGLRS